MWVERVTLLPIGIANLFYNLSLFLLESLLFFIHWNLWRLRWLLLTHYLIGGPWIFSRLEGSRKSVRESGVSLEDLTYGETPFLTARELLLWARVTRDDTLLDVGSGTGRVVLFSSLYFGLKSVGVEILPTFVRVARLIARKLKNEKAEFIEGNFLHLDFSPFTIVYVAGTSFTLQTLKALKEKLKDLRSGARVISLSTPLRAPHLEVVGEKICSFSWGKTRVFLHKRA